MKEQVIKPGDMVKLRPGWKCGTYFRSVDNDEVGGSMSPGEVAVALNLSEAGDWVMILSQHGSGWIWRDVLRRAP